MVDTAPREFLGERLTGPFRASAATPDDTSDVREPLTALSSKCFLRELSGRVTDELRHGLTSQSSSLAHLTVELGIQT
jgi:hypothetical protein